MPTPGLKRAAFFDLDRTLLEGSSLLALAWPLYRGGFIKSSTLMIGVLNQLIFQRRGASTSTIASISDRIGPLIAGIEAKDVEACVTKAVEHNVIPRLFPHMVEILKAHQARGDLTYIVSSAPREIAEPIARFLGVQGIICTDVEVIDGKYTGQIPHFCYGEEKVVSIRAAAVRDNIDLSRSFAYSDGVSDVPMLESVGHPVCVNPDKELKQIARERKWQQIRTSAPSRRIARRLPALSLGG